MVLRQHEMAIANEVASQVLAGLQGTGELAEAHGLIGELAEAQASLQQLASESAEFAEALKAVGAVNANLRGHLNVVESAARLLSSHVGVVVRVLLNNKRYTFDPEMLVRLRKIQQHVDALGEVMQ